MEIYLIRHGHANHERAIDPYSVEISPKGLAQSERLAEKCQQWDLQLLIASTMTRAQQTADAIEQRSPDVIRWDLKELEEMNVDDLQLDPTAAPLVSTWTTQQLDLGLQRLWIRVMAALVRIEIYAQANGLERIAIVTHGYVIKVLLLNWLGLDWRAGRRLRIPVGFCGTCKIGLREGGVVRIEWINRQYGLEQ